MPTKLKKIPKFNSEKEERKFWQIHSSTDYVDWSKAERVNFPNLKLNSKPTENIYSQTLQKTTGAWRKDLISSAYKKLKQVKRKFELSASKARKKLW